MRLWRLDGNPIGRAFQSYTIQASASNSIALNYQSPGSAVSSIVFNQDGKTVIVAYRDGSVRTWQIDSEHLLHVACDRLRDHPILKNPSNEEERGAKKTCEENVWNLPKQTGQNGEIIRNLSNNIPPSTPSRQTTIANSSAPSIVQSSAQNVPSPTPVSNKRQNNYRQAPSDRNQPSKLKFTSLETYINQGLVYHKQRNYQQAISSSSRAIALNPNSAIAYSNRAAAYIGQKDYQKASADSSKAISLNPTYANAYINRGLAYYYQGKYQQAIANYNKAIKLAPGNALVYSNRALAYTRLGNQQAAQADRQKAAALSQRQF
jgi:tetratricopeptide (TPR) repeat protein